LNKLVDIEFFKNKRIFITGHTGFKGSWLCRILINAGAEVTGYALEPPTEPNLFSICGVGEKITSIIGDIRDRDSLISAFKQASPEITIHLAAQPIVCDSYKHPSYTYKTNVMGTVNILECIRLHEGVRSFLNVTTDKVYRNNEWSWGYRETDTLDGYDPYSNSKSCSELVTSSYKNAFFTGSITALSTARAGNVIGGGDFSNDRIIPDCIRAAVEKKPIIVRNPCSIRPYQHVLEPLLAYLMIVQMQYDNNEFAGCYNIGPDDKDCVSTGYLADAFCKAWGNGQTWESKSLQGPHEASFLKLDCSKLKAAFGWKPLWDIAKAVDKTVEWTRGYLTERDICSIMECQINEYLQCTQR